MSPFPFLSLPRELRDCVYHFLLSPAHNHSIDLDEYKTYHYRLALLRANQQIYHEARRVLRLENIFVAISTPWPEAQPHATRQGFVPMLATGNIADRFRHQHLDVIIDAPAHRAEDAIMSRFIILLDDLPSFAQMWFYSDLGYPGLNEHLRLTLALRDPYSPSYEQRTIPKKLQQRLIEPFGIVKHLNDVVIRGEHYSSIETSLREAMKEKQKSPLKCLEEAERLKELGNQALTAKNYTSALSFYEQAHIAMHIVVYGRRRSVWADAFFQTELREGPHKGEYGQMVRLVLRITLVANIVMAYLNMENYEMAYFWGMRSIKIMREASKNEEPMPGPWPAPKQMGKIYYRTAKACTKIGYNMEAEKLFKVALEYLPGDRKVIVEELKAVQEVIKSRSVS